MVAVKLTPVEAGHAARRRHPTDQAPVPERRAGLPDAALAAGGRPDHGRALRPRARTAWTRSSPRIRGERPEVGFAGRLDPSNIGPVSRIGQWLERADVLTRYDQVITDPSQITGDYTFVQAAADEEYQAVVLVDRDLGWLTGGLLALLGLTLLAVVPTRILYKRRIRAERRRAPRRPC